MDIHFDVTRQDIPEVPFPSRTFQALGYDEDDEQGGYRHTATGQRFTILEVQVPDRKNRTVEQYLAFKAAVAELKQVYRPSGILG